MCLIIHNYQVVFYSINHAWTNKPWLNIMSKPICSSRTKLIIRWKIRGLKSLFPQPQWMVVGLWNLTTWCKKGNNKPFKMASQGWKTWKLRRVGLYKKIYLKPGWQCFDLYILLLLLSSSGQELFRYALFLRCPTTHYTT